MRLPIESDTNIFFRKIYLPVHNFIIKICDSKKYVVNREDRYTFYKFESKILYRFIEYFIFQFPYDHLFTSNQQKSIAMLPTNWEWL